MSVKIGEREQCQGANIHTPTTLFGVSADFISGPDVADSGYGPFIGTSRDRVGQAASTILSE